MTPRILALAALSLALSPDAEACPCVTLVDSHMEEVGQRALMIVEPDELHYVLQIAVEGNATELGWLVPTPTVAATPTLADKDLFERLEEQTSPNLWACSEDSSGCVASDKAERGNLQGGVNVWAQGKLDNLDYAVLSASDGTDLTAWLQSNNYPVSTKIQQVIDAYVVEGWSFVALKVSGTALNGDRPTLGPVMISVPHTGTPVFPLRMSGLSTSERISLMLYVAANTKMKPKQMPIVTIDKTKLASKEDGSNNYEALVREAVDAQGSGFVLEYAEQTYQVTSPPLQNLLDNKKIVRLFTDIPPSKLTDDLELESASITAPTFDCVPQDTTDESGCSAVRRASSLLQFGLLVLIVLGIRTRRAH